MKTCERCGAVNLQGPPLRLSCIHCGAKLPVTRCKCGEEELPSGYGSVERTYSDGTKRMHYVNHCSVRYRVTYKTEDPSCS